MEIKPVLKRPTYQSTITQSELVQCAACVLVFVRASEANVICMRLSQRKTARAIGTAYGISMLMRQVYA